jgi:hypothetical protein
MPAGWRSVIAEYWPSRLPGQYNASDLGRCDVVQILSPNMPDPTQAQLDEIAATYVRFGGYATARVVARYWYGYVQYTSEQIKALQGVP